MGQIIEKSVQKVPDPWHIVCFILNIFFPGVGTMVSGYFASGGINCDAMVVGILQLVLVPVFLIGWICSIIWGFRIYDKSK